ncbi:MAG: hypothetical protein HQ582_19260, partial [Planctomycetes bacterium]|nr:hypothetical protein [Planctomycetota bacterium]
MRTVPKYALAGIIFASMILSLSCWIGDDHGGLSRQTIVWLGLGFAAVAVGGVLVALLVIYRGGTAPDLLREQFGSCFERDGLCFVFAPSVDKGVFVLNVWFQNRYVRACQARISLTLRRLPREERVPWHVEIDCDDGAFGATRVPWGIPVVFQGAEHRFDVHACVRYPRGRGKTLRFREGAAVGLPPSDIPRWRRFLRMALILGAACVGQAWWSTPAHV